MARWNELLATALLAETPAPALKGVTLAQWALESGWGTSRLAVEHQNFAGLKWRPELGGLATRISYRAHDGVDDYCAFASIADFIRGYWAFIGRSVYDGWSTHASDPAAFIRFIAGKGYAADPNYAVKILALTPRMEALVSAFDAVSGGRDGANRQGPPEEARPSRHEMGERVSDLVTPSEEPRFKSLGHVRHKYRAKRAAGLEGAIIHYDAGRTRPLSGGANDDWGAIKTLEYAQGQGYAYATVSRSGTIFLPTNMDWEKWGSHAGESRCPLTNRTWVSQFYVGFEVNSPGILYPTADPDIFVPWFDAVRDRKDNVVLDRKGHAKVDRANGELYQKSELCFVARKQGNLSKGAYVPYTDAQVQALVNVILWLKRSFKSFEIEKVFGHDEVSPGRKSDPGGCLIYPASTGLSGACGMATFREYLQQAWQQQKARVR